MSISRSKVSGPGKRVEQLPCYVSKWAYYSEPDWLMIGFELWRSTVGSAGCMLPVPTQDLQGVGRRPLQYSEALCCTGQLHREIASPEVYFVPSAEGSAAGAARDGYTWVAGTDRLLLGEACRFWTEHSERNGIITIGASLGIPKDMLDRVGR